MLAYESQKTTYFTLFKKLQICQGNGNPETRLNAQQLLLRSINLYQASERAHRQDGCTVVKN
jgi:hypothetical protein